MNVIVARFGTAALSANSFAFSYMHVCFMPAIGVGQAVTALVGKYIGMGRPGPGRPGARTSASACARSTWCSRASDCSCGGIR
jgi:Na+-driven multidrug efflux pump